MALHLNKLESSSVQNVWLKLAQWFLRGRFLKILMYFCYVFCYNPPLEKGGALLLNRLQSHLPKDALYHFIWNWPIGSGVKKSFNFINFFFLLFCYYLPLEKGGDLPMNKLESPSSKNALCQVWLKFALWFYRIFLNYVNEFQALHLNKTWIPFTQHAQWCLVSRFGWNWTSDFKRFG